MSQGCTIGSVMEDKTRSQKWYKFDPSRIQDLRDDFSSLSDEDKDDELYESNENEVYWALLLIQAKFIEPNVFSSPDWIQEIQERFKLIKETPSLLSQLVDVLLSLGYELEPVPGTVRSDSNFMPMESMVEAMGFLQCQWEQLGYSSDDKFDWRACKNSIPNLKELNSVHAFMSSVLEGSFPTPEVMLSIAKSFDLYLTAAGDLSLEEVFFGRPKRRGGNFAFRWHKELTFQYFHDTVLGEKGRLASLDQKFHINDLAEKFLTYNYANDAGDKRRIDVDTFLRGYRRWRREFEKSEIFDENRDEEG